MTEKNEGEGSGATTVVTIVPLVALLGVVAFLWDPALPS